MADKPSKNFKNYIRALRLPFVSVSILPFIFGSLLVGDEIKILHFILGLFTVLAAHLSANLINDYADSKSGVDWQDRNFYKFFGGSKLIQEKVFSENFYFKAAAFFGLLATCLVFILAFKLKSISIIGFYLLIIFLAWFYSQPPLQLSYRGMGELIIFLLFGPALVMGGHYIQSEIFPTLEGFILSLPFGFLTAAILFANEVPDYSEDKKKNKLNWVDICKEEKAFILYSLLIIHAFLFIGLSIILGFLSPLSLLAFLLIIPAFKAAAILRRHFGEKDKLVESSKLTIAVHTAVSIILILDLLL